MQNSSKVAFYLKSILDNNFDPFDFVSKDIQFKSLEKGILFIRPESSDDSRKIILSCAIHGNETAPIEIINELLNEIVSGQLIPKNELLIIFGSPKAMINQTRFVDVNLNRQFSDLPYTVDNYETSRAVIIKNACDKFLSDFSGEINHYDLHTAIRPSHIQKFAIAPIKNHLISNDALEELNTLGIEAVVLNDIPSTTFSYYTFSKFKAASFTLELGKVRPFGQNNIDDFKETKKGLQQVVKGKINTSSQVPKIFRVKEELIRDKEDYFFSVSATEKNFAPLNENEKIDSVYTAKEKDRILFPNPKVAVGQRSGLVITPISLTEFS